MSLLGGGGREEVKSLSSLASVSSSSSAHLALLGGGREWRVRNGSTNSPQRSVYPVDALTLAATTYTHNQSGSCPQTVGIESAPSVKPWAARRESLCVCLGQGSGIPSHPVPHQAPPQLPQGQSQPISHLKFPLVPGFTHQGYSAPGTKPAAG